MFDVIVTVQDRKHITFLKSFCPPCTSDRIYVFRNCFSNYAYVRHMYKTLKGIGKIIFVSRLTIFLRANNFAKSVISKLHGSLY